MLAAIDWHMLFFALFALIACGFALAVLFSSNIVRMAFSLVLSLGAVAGLFFLAGAEFVGAMQLMIYVGGTLVLLVFGVMLTAQSRFVHMKAGGGEWVVALILGGTLLCLLLRTAFTVGDWQTPHAYHRLLHSAEELHRIAEQADDTKAESLGERQDELAGLTAIIEEELIAVADQLSQLGETESANTAKRLGENVADVGRQVSAVANELEAEAAIAALAKAEHDLRELADEVAPAIYESKTTTPIGLALSGVRLDKSEGPVDRPNSRSGYLLPFVIVSIHLLVVLIGAAYMARAKRRVDRDST